MKKSYLESSNIKTSTQSMNSHDDATAYESCTRLPANACALRCDSTAQALFDHLIVTAPSNSDFGTPTSDHDIYDAAEQATLHDAMRLEEMRAEYNRYNGESLHQSTIAAGLVTRIDAALLQIRLQMAPLRRVHNGGSRLESQI